MKITREIISDLWPIYASGEASADTRALVDEFLQQDTEFARLLTENKAESLLKMPAPALPPDNEMKAFKQTKRQLFGWTWAFFFAVLFSCFAFGRIISDTSWDRSPRPFIVTAAIAGTFWIIFFARLIWVRKSVLTRRK